MASDRINIQFVQEVEKHPCLYDPRLVEYSRKEATEKAWEEIGTKFQLAGAECKEKWKNLRSVFVRHLKPAKHGTGKPQKRPYYLSEYMQFTIPFVKPSAFENSEKKRKTSQDINVDYALDEDTDVDVLSTTSQHISQHESTTSFPKLDPAELMQELQSRPSSLLSAGESLPSPSEHHVPEKKTSKRKYDYCDEQNSNRMFLLSLLSDMNKMNDKQRRVFKRKLLCLVDDILDGNNDGLHNSNTYISTPTPNNSSTVFITANNINDILSSADIDHTYSADNNSAVIKTEY